MIDTARGLLASEWLKVRSVRSTYWTMIIAVVITVGLGYVVGAVTAGQWDDMKPADKADLDPVGLSFIGGSLAQVAFGILGVMVIGSEYTTGMIRTTFTAVPQRRTVLAAKAVVIGAITLVLGLVMCFGAFFLAQLALSAENLDISLGDQGVLRAVLGAGFYMMVITLVGFGLGAIIRHSTGAIAALFGLVFILPPMLLLLPRGMRTPIRKFSLDGASNAVLDRTNDADLLSPGAGFLVCGLYAAIALTAALILVTRRDA